MSCWGNSDSESVCRTVFVSSCSSLSYGCALNSPEFKASGGNSEHAHTHTHTHGGLKNKTEINKRMSNCRDRSEGATPTWRDNTEEKGSLESGGERRRWGGSSAVLTLSSKLSLVEEAAPGPQEGNSWSLSSVTSQIRKRKTQTKTNYNHFFFFILASCTSAAAVVISFPTHVWT